MSIFTSLMPGGHMVSNPNPYDEDNIRKLKENMVSMAELLKKKGYYTVGIHGGGCVDAIFGFDRGFDSYTDGFFFNFHDPFYRPGRELNAIRRQIKLSREKGKPLFLFLQHYLCHDPYIKSPPALTFTFWKKKCRACLLDGAIY